MGRAKFVLCRGQFREKNTVSGRETRYHSGLYAWKVSLDLNKKLYVQREINFAIWSFQVFAERWVLNICLLNAQAFLMPASAHLSTFPTAWHSMIACASVCWLFTCTWWKIALINNVLVRLGITCGMPRHVMVSCKHWFHLCHLPALEWRRGA